MFYLYKQVEQKCSPKCIYVTLSGTVCLVLLGNICDGRSFYHD